MYQENRCVIDDGSNIDRRSIQADTYTHFAETDAFWKGRRSSYPAGISAAPPSTKGTEGLFSCKGTAYLRDGRHQTPRASNSRSNCIAWRRTNDCIFASRHRVAIGKLARWTTLDVSIPFSLPLSRVDDTFRNKGEVCAAIRGTESRC